MMLNGCLLLMHSRCSNILMDRHLVMGRDILVVSLLICACSAMMSRRLTVKVLLAAIRILLLILKGVTIGQSRMV